MRRARITYEGAFHHGMNRGYEGRSIFANGDDKNVLLDLIEKNQELTRMRILAYCVMDTHYHVVLQNNSAHMSDFFKQVNGQYGSYFRKKYGGRGYVFQDRYKSQLIQDDTYLMMSIAYVLNNPLKAGLCKSYADYPWSSGNCYFAGKECSFIDRVYVMELFGNEANLQGMAANLLDIDELPSVKSEMGMIIGGEEFLSEAKDKADRRSDRESEERKRRDDRLFEPVQKVFFEFENKHDVKVEALDISSYTGKRLRSELLVNLKEKAGLRYTEMAKLDIFGDLTINSLASIYHRWRKKRSK